MAWIPEPIYKALPAAYAVAGVGLVVAFGTQGPAALSALALLAAAGLTALWRYQHRDDTPSTPEPSPQKLEWEARRAKRESQAMNKTLR
jgi:uncharacterized membrane protein YhiD involved in acid resistance